MHGSSLVMIGWFYRVASLAVRAKAASMNMVETFVKSDTQSLDHFVSQHVARMVHCSFRLRPAPIWIYWCCAYVAQLHQSPLVYTPL